MAAENEGYVEIYRFVTEQLRAAVGKDEAQLNLTAAEIVAQTTAQVAAETAAETASEVASQMTASTHPGA